MKTMGRLGLAAILLAACHDKTDAPTPQPSVSAPAKPTARDCVDLALSTWPRFEPSFDARCTLRFAPDPPDVPLRLTWRDDPSFGITGARRLVLPGAKATLSRALVDPSMEQVRVLTSFTCGDLATSSVAFADGGVQWAVSAEGAGCRVEPLSLARDHVLATLHGSGDLPQTLVLAGELAERPPSIQARAPAGKPLRTLVASSSIWASAGADEVEVGPFGKLRDHRVKLDGSIEGLVAGESLGVWLAKGGKTAGTRLAAIDLQGAVTTLAPLASPSVDGLAIGERTIAWTERTDATHCQLAIGPEREKGFVVERMSIPCPRSGWALDAGHALAAIAGGKLLVVRRGDRRAWFVGHGTDFVWTPLAIGGGELWLTAAHAGEVVLVRAPMPTGEGEALVSEGDAGTR